MIFQAAVFSPNPYCAEFGWKQGQDFEMGKTKIFIQDGTSHIEIETKRSAAVEELVVKLQSFYRGYRARVSFKHTKSVCSRE